MSRYYTGLAVALFECMLFAWPSSALGSFDLFATKQYVASGPFAGSSDAAMCQRDKIQKQLTLVDVVDLALCNNPQTRSVWASSRVQAAQLGTSLSAYLPTLSGPVSVLSSRTRVGATTTDSTLKDATISISYLLYDFGGREADVENSKQLLVAANATRDETLQSVLLTAVQSYYTLFSARASVQSYQIAEVAASKSLDAAQARYQAGTATQADRLQAQTALSQTVLNRIRAEGDAANAQGALANIMGFDANQPFVLVPIQENSPDLAAEQGIGKLIEEARRNRPDLAAAEAQIKAAEAQVASTKASGLPTFTLNGGITRSESNDGTASTSHSNSLGIRIDVPWFSGYRDTYRNRAAQAQLEGKVAERDRLANQIALEVWQAYQALLTNSQALRAADDLVASAAESEKIALGRYKAGVGSILDALTAQSTLASAHQQRVSALYNFQASKFALAQAMGRLDLTLPGIKN